MVLLQTLTNRPAQRVDVMLADGTIFSLTLYYRLSVQRWMFDVAYKSFVSNGMSLCVHPNILRNWRQVIPFGLAILSSDGADPFNVEDFINGRISLYVLDQTLDNTDVDDVEREVFGQVVA